MKINDLELEFDYLEEQTNMRVMQALNRISDESEKAAHEEETYLQIAAMCTAIKTGFDYIFGEGVGNQLCGEGNNLDTCLDAFTEFIMEKNRQDAQLKMKASRMLQAIQNGLSD